MEIAIPLVALGSMYLVANKKKVNNLNIEKFTPNNTENLKYDKTHNLPNMLPAKNYPTAKFSSTSPNGIMQTMYNYPNPNQETDKYFNQTEYIENERIGKKVGNEMQKYYSLDGSYLTSEQFQHQNMNPFNGGKVRGYNYNIDNNESILDNMNGTGSQTIRKQEQPPLFQSMPTLNYVNGIPNQSDFYQSRINPSQKISSTLPFEQIKVGPGLNEGYNSHGSELGFNTPLEARERWQPRQVDELRIATNPKLEYTLDGLEGPINPSIKNSATIQTLGKVEKNTPDTFYINTPDRWLVTTSTQKGETLRPNIQLSNAKQYDGNSLYLGPGNTPSNMTYVPQQLLPSKREESQEIPMNYYSGTNNMIGQGPLNTSELESYQNSIINTKRGNEESTKNYIGNAFQSTLNVIFQPLLDYVRPTRKEETIENLRLSSAGITTSVPQPPTTSQSISAKTTIRETTLYEPRSYINNFTSMGTYLPNQLPPSQTNRECLPTDILLGPSSTKQGLPNYESSYSCASTGSLREPTMIHSYIPSGTLPLFNNPYKNNIQLRNDDNSIKFRSNPAYSSLSVIPPSTEIIGHQRNPQSYDQINCSRIQPDILNAFKNNPYTQPLDSY